MFQRRLRSLLSCGPMLHCQRCGAPNAEDARFCNQCGGRIAHKGEPGGPLDSQQSDSAGEPTMRGHGGQGRKGKSGEGPSVEEKRASDRPPRAPRAAGPSERGPEPELPSRLDVSSVSLAAIGVRSRAKAWGVLLGACAVLIGVGAGATWLVMHSSEGEAVARNDPPPSEPDEPIEVGDAVPEGLAPEGVDIVTGTPRPATGTRTARPSSGSATPRPSSGTSSTRPSTGSSSTGSTSRPTTEPTGSASDTPRAGSGGATGGTEPSAGSTNEAAPNEPNEPAAGTGERQVDWESMEEEPDLAMEAYTTQVRNVVRTYYATRAQSCFEHETRNEQSVRGTVVIGFDVQADGSARNAHVVRNTTGIQTLGGCLARQVGSWQFPRPPEAPLAMQMPFSR